MPRSRGRCEKMRDAGALCHCGSHDVRFDGWSPYKQDQRPMFRCGSCGSTWTAGTDGEPYIRFVTPTTPYPGPVPDDEFGMTPGQERQWDAYANIGRKNRRKLDAAAKRRAALKRK